MGNKNISANRFRDITRNFLLGEADVEDGERSETRLLNEILDQQENKKSRNISEERDSRPTELHLLASKIEEILERLALLESNISNSTKKNII